MTPEHPDYQLIIGIMERWADGTEPVWSHERILREWGREFMMYRDAWDLEDRGFILPAERCDRSYQLFKLRQIAIDKFGFLIPSLELLDALKWHEPIVEIGAGTGYMTCLMRHHGIDVIGTEAGYGEHWEPEDNRRYDPMQMKMEGKRAVRRYRDRTVFCSWPSYRLTWFRQALKAMRIGQRLILVEEDCCSEEDAWEYRDTCFEEGERIPLATWPHMNDYAYVWTKKRQGARYATDNPGAAG